MDKTLRLSLCRLIAGIVVSDDELDPAEEAFVDRMLASFGIAEMGRDAIFPIVDRSDAVAAIRELPADVQKTALDLLVEASVADGTVVKEERAYLDAVAGELGVSSAQLQAAIDAKLKVRAV